MIGRISRSAAASLAWAASLAMSPSAAVESCDGSVAANRGIVLDFYNEGLVGKQAESAFARYMAPDFVEHKPDVPKGTRAETAKYLSRIIAAVPGAQWEIIRTIAEGNMVFLHARFTPATGAPFYALADIFRVEGCKIVEHWDVVGPPPKEQLNSQLRF